MQHEQHCVNYFHRAAVVPPSSCATAALAAATQPSKLESTAQSPVSTSKGSLAAHIMPTGGCSELLT